MVGHVLVVEDERKIASLLKDYLENAGFKISSLDRGDQVLPCVKKRMPDLIMLDLMLPGMDGMDVCREVRKFSSVPIIMITAKAEEIDRLIGLELGADDYICKPFSPREVVARVKAVLRRTRHEAAEEKFHVGPVALDTVTRQVLVNGRSLDLTPTEFGILKVLIRQPNRVFSRNELLNQVQGYNFEGYDRTIDTHIKNLRKKIAEILPESDLIETVYGVGYRFRLTPSTGQIA